MHELLWTLFRWFDIIAQRNTRDIRGRRGKETSAIFAHTLTLSRARSTLYRRMEESCSSMIVYVEDPKWSDCPMYTNNMLRRVGHCGKVEGTHIGGLTHNDPTSLYVWSCGKCFYISSQVADRDPFFFFTTWHNSNNSSGLSTGCDLPLSTILSRKTTTLLCLRPQPFPMTTPHCSSPTPAWTRHVPPLSNCQK